MMGPYVVVTCQANETYTIKKEGADTGQLAAIPKRDLARV